MNWFTEEDKKHLESFDDKNRVIRDAVRTVARRETPGLYVYGPGGTAKSYTVESVLKEEDAAYIIHNSQMTAPGLYVSIHDNPNATIVLDDVNSLFKNEVARQILASAMAENTNGERWVEHSTIKGTERVQFFGGIIALSNRPLGRDSFSKAIASRMIPLRYEPNQPELIASLKNFAMTVGLKDISIDESIEVVSFLISASVELGKTLDLRHTEKAAGFFRAAQTGLESTWQDLVVALVKGEADTDGPKLPLNRAEKKAGDLEIALEIIKQAKANDWNKAKMKELWTKTTGKSDRTFYRCHSDLERDGQIESSQPSQEERLAKLKLHLGENESQAS